MNFDTCRTFSILIIAVIPDLFNTHGSLLNSICEVQLFGNVICCNFQCAITVIGNSYINRVALRTVGGIINYFSTIFLSYGVGMNSGIRQAVGDRFECDLLLILHGEGILARFQCLSVQRLGSFKGHAAFCIIGVCEDKPVVRILHGAVGQCSVSIVLSDRNLNRLRSSVIGDTRFNSLFFGDGIGLLILHGEGILARFQCLSVQRLGSFKGHAAFCIIL